MTLSICLSFDVDAEFSWLARVGGESGPVWESQGRYGPREGLPRVLALLAEFDLPATFFCPGLTVEHYPAAIESIVAAGHEIECHGYTHIRRDRLSPADEEDELVRCSELIERATGRRPRGFRSPAAEVSPLTFGLLVDHGYDYTSDLFDRDSPYIMDVPDHGTLVQLPFAWVFDDAPFFRHNNRIGGTMAAPSAVLEAWVLEYEGLREEPDRLLMLAMHPQYIGRPSRMWVLRQFVQRVLEGGGARFVPASLIAAETRQRAERDAAPTAAESQ